MKVVTSLYGNRYLSLLIVFLASLRKVEKEVEVYVLWCDIDNNLIEPVIAYFKKGIVFINTKLELKLDHSSHTNYYSSIKSSKLFQLEKIYKYIDEGEELIFIDADVIFVGGLKEIFNKSFDIAFTPLDSVRYKYPLNSGVIFLRNNTLTRSLIKHMGEHVTQIVEDPAENQISVNKYGGADQAAFCRVLNFKSDGRIDNRLIIKNVHMLELPAAIYNNFEATEEIGDTRIIHLKGSWQTLMFSGRSLSSLSNKGIKAMVIYKLFLNTFMKTVTQIYNANFLSVYQDRFGIKVPVYFYKCDDQLFVDNIRMIYYTYLERIYRYFFNRGLQFFYKPIGTIIFKKFSFWLR